MAASFSPGHRFGPYELVELIGRGGFGEVYRARDVRLGREVAVKTVRGSITHESFRRFEVEARATAALNHPNIIAIHDVGFEPDVAYVVTELLEGESLRGALRRGPLPLRLAIAYARQIVDALSAAHAKGIVHRDLKPENVFVLPGERIKVLDFGLAKVSTTDVSADADRETQPALTEAGAILGTPAYLAPEQARGTRVDHRADLFNVGVILYEMLAGVSPFRGPTTADTVMAILRDPPPALTHAEAIPELDRIVRRCLEKDPAARFQSASDLGFALQTASPPPRRARGLTRPLIAALVTVSVLAGLGWMAGLFRRASPDVTRGGGSADLVRQTVAVSARMDPDLIAGLFPSSNVSVTTVDATHLDVGAPKDRMPSIVSVLGLVDALQGHQFFDEAALGESAPGARLFSGLGQSKARVSLAVRDASVRGLLQVMAKAVSWPVIFDPSVQGRVTLTMDDVPWDLVVRSCLEFQGADLTLSRIGDVWLVSTRARAAELVNNSLSVWITRARRASAADLARAFEPARTERGLILTNTRLNAVVIVDRFDAFPDYARVLATIDGVGTDAIEVPRPQRRYTGNRVSFDFSDANLASVLRTFGEISGLNVVVERALSAGLSPPGDAFSGTLTDARWDNAFDVVLAASSMTYTMRDRLVHVTPAGPDVTDMMVETITLQREDPAFFEPFSKYLTSRGALSFERQTRTLVIRDAGHRVRNLQAWVRVVDRRTP